MKKMGLGGMSVKVVSVATASDGVLIVVDDDGDLWEVARDYHDGGWEAFPLDIRWNDATAPEKGR